MYGTTLTNAHVKALIRSKVMDIAPFKDENLKLSHYRLRPHQLFELGAQDASGVHARGLPIHDFKDGKAFVFAPNQYLLVTILERVVLRENIVGEVVAASTLIEQGFGLVAGKLDPDYGEELDFIVGLKNLLNERNSFHPGRGIANISFRDFRGTKSLKVRWAEADTAAFNGRDLSPRRERIVDDGPAYDEEDE